MAMLMRRLGAGQFTVHGFRSSFRDWAAETGVVFEVAEASPAHAIGSNVTRSYLRTTMLERRRPIMAARANFVRGSDADNVLPFKTASGE
jgi:integrase